MEMYSKNYKVQRSDPRIPAIILLSSEDMFEHLWGRESTVLKQSIHTHTVAIHIRQTDNLHNMYRATTPH